MTEDGGYIITDNEGRILTNDEGVILVSPPSNLAPLLLQAIVRAVGDHPEGQLIDVIEAPWRLILDAISKDPRARFQIEPRKLEEMIACAYKDYGFDEVILTPRSGDRGRDVIATKRGRFEVRIIDSVKALGEGRRVGHDDVRALLGVMSGDLKTNKGIVTTTAEFAPGIVSDPYISSFLPTRLQLVNGTELISRLNELSTKRRKE